MNLKKLLCLLLALVMVLSLAACDSSSGRDRDRDRDDDDEDEEISEDKDKNRDDEDEDEDDAPAVKEPEELDYSEEILGSWTVDIVLTEDYTGMEGLEITGIPFVFTFEEDGTVKLTVDPSAAQIIMDQMLVVLVDMFYDEMEAEGMSRDQVDSLFVETYGMTVEDYMVSAIAEMDMGTMLEDIEETADYELEGETLILDGIEMTIEIKGDKMTITACDSDFWEEVGLDIPVTMKRVK